MSEELHRKNTIALRDEQIRIRSLAQFHEERIIKLESELLAVRAELMQVKAIAAAAIGKGATGGIS